MITIPPAFRGSTPESKAQCTQVSVASAHLMSKGSKGREGFSFVLPAHGYLISRVDPVGSPRFGKAARTLTRGASSRWTVRGGCQGKTQYKKQRGRTRKRCHPPQPGEKPRASRVSEPEHRKRFFFLFYCPWCLSEPRASTRARNPGLKSRLVFFCLLRVISRLSENQNALPFC